MAEEPADQAETEPEEETVSVMDLLVKTVVSRDLALDSDEVADLVAETAMVLAAKAGTWDPTVLDFDGNKYLNTSDLSYLLMYWGMTANKSCYRDNPDSRYEAILQHYDPNT